MRLVKSSGPFLLFLSLGSAAARADDTSPLAVLKEKGLTKSGTVYVIEAEKPVMQKIKQVNAVLAIHAKLAERQALEDQVGAHLEFLEKSRSELQERLTELNQQIIEQASMSPNNSQRPGQNSPAQTSPLVAQRNQIKSALAEVAMEQKELKPQSSTPKDKAALDDEVKKRGEAAKAALAEVRPMIDEVSKKYADLENDGAIKQARSDFQKATKATFKLGPSEAFRAAVKSIDLAERQMLGKKPATVLRKKSKAKK